MAVIAFDTHEFVKELKDAGFSEQQAEVITNLQKATVSNAIEQARHDYELDKLATKYDLRELELKTELVKSELKRDIERVRKEIEQSKADLQRFIISVVFGTAILQTAIVAGLVFRLAGKW